MSKKHTEGPADGHVAVRVRGTMVVMLLYAGGQVALR